MDKTGMDAVRGVTSLAALARDLGIGRSAIAQWDRVPAERIKDVSAFTGLPYKVLRPDLYPEPSERSEVA